MAGQTSPARGRLEGLSWTLGLAVAAAWVYAPALAGGWLWDDREDVPDNVLLKLPQGLKYIWSGQFGNDYYPLKSTVQWAQWRIWGGDTTGYHGTNVVLHILSGLLFAAILQRLGLKRIWAWGAALLWIVHPIAVGAVAWIAELKDALSCTLLLVAVRFYLDFDEERRKGAYVAALVAFVAAMLAKSGVMMFPVWLLLFHWVRGSGGPAAWLGAAPEGRRLRRSRLASPKSWALSVAPFFAVTVALGGVAVRLQAARSMASDGAGLGGAGFRLVLACRSLLFYFWHSIWPAGMSPVYERWANPGGVAGALAVGAVVALAAAVAWLWLRRQWAIVLGVGWFVLNLAPVLGLVGISFMRFTWVMDHFAYVPLLGLCALVAAGLQALADRGTAARVAAAGLLLAAVAACACISRGYAHAYQGEEQIWSYAVARNPNLWAPQSNLGSVLMNRGAIDAAEEHLRAAIRLAPDAPDAHRNLGVVMADRGKVQDAIAEASEALRLRPGFALAEEDLVRDYVAAGRLDLALPHAAEAIRLQPNDPERRNDAAVVLFKLGRVADAEKQLEAAVQLAPNNGRFQASLGLALGQLGRIKEALPHFEAAARLMPDDADVRKNIGIARKMLGQ